jgi:hypothetical protein
MVKRWVARLEEVDNSILRCAVLIEPYKEQIHVRIDVTIPDREITVLHNPHRPTTEDFYVTVSDAFRATRRRLIELTPAKEASTIGRR